MSRCGSFSELGTLGKEMVYGLYSCLTRQLLLDITSSIRGGLGVKCAMVLILKHISANDFAQWRLWAPVEVK